MSQECCGVHLSGINCYVNVGVVLPVCLAGQSQHPSFNDSSCSISLTEGSQDYALA